MAGGGHGGPDVSREGVQRDILPIVEGTTVNTKYGMVKTDHICSSRPARFTCRSRRISFPSCRTLFQSG